MDPLVQLSYSHQAGKFLGFMVHERGIEANHEKIKAILDLNELAFQALQEYLASPPLLVKPFTGDELQLYLAVSEAATSGALVKECSERPDVSSRLVLWALELTQFDIKYKSRSTIKAQALADFVVEFSVNPNLDNKPDFSPNQADLNWLEDNKTWILYTDGASSQSGCGTGTVVIDSEGVECSHCSRFEFRATNNEAEYEALLARMRVAEALGADFLLVKSDSQLVVN
ncbi:hypothetical protein LWI28_004980 [Acer negundo]|uniref:RNase H type-1 domain-containing protein n=1 Tax=Acer negundo TaxID=4023 RepID=A0AAD5NKG1_ACENE|nr:hypothetical protein LWI28_004980 [Acer negundo]